MSFVRKMFFKPSLKKSGSVVECNTSDVIVDDSQFDQVEEDVDLIDVFRMEKKLVIKDKDLNTKFRKFAKQEKKMNRLQKHLIQMDRELVELRRMLRQTDLQKNALEAEVDCKKEELKDAACLVQMDFEVDVRKKEPMLYKKYNNIKTTADAKTLLGTIKNKQKALQHLEILTFKKYLNNNHDLKKETAMKNTRDSTPPLVPPKKPRRSCLPARFGGNSRYNTLDAFVTRPFGTHPLFRGLYGLNNPEEVELHPQSEVSLEDELDGVDSVDLEEFDGVDNPALVTEL